MNPDFLTPRRATRSDLAGWAIAAIVAAQLVPTAGAHAQAAVAARGAGPDARTPPAGTLRVGIGATWTRNAESYDADGRVHELGARFTLDPLGAAALPILGPVESATRSLAALSDFTASLGRSVVHARKTRETTPLVLEYGVTARLALGIVVPFVTSISRVDLAVSPLGLGASVGFNPSLTSPAAADANSQLLSQFDAAAAFLNGRIGACAAAPASPGCGTINTNAEAARALVVQSTAFATTLGTLYGGRAGTSGAPFVPLAGTAAQAAIDARIAGFKAQYAALGATQIQAAGPIGAGAPLTASDFQRVLTDTSFRFIVNPLGSVVRRGVGDVDLSATWQWHDSWSGEARTGPLLRRIWWRSAVTGTLRVGTGMAPDAADLIPVATGDHQHDIEVRSITDAGIGTRFSITSAFRYTYQATADATVRFATGGGDPFAYQPNTVSLKRDLGDELEVAFYPRIALSEAVSVAGSYSYRRKFSDRDMSPGVSDENPTDASIATASSPRAGTDERAHAVGAALAYSTLAAHSRGNARWPIEVSLEHFQTTRGSGGVVPKLAHDAVVVRYYWRLRRATPGRVPD